MGPWEKNCWMRWSGPANIASLWLLWKAECYMRIMFVYWAFEDQGSGLLIQGYTKAAQELGHEVVVYGKQNPKIPLNYSLDINSADAVVFVFEWTTDLLQGDRLDLLRLVTQIPRKRRVI